MGATTDFYKVKGEKKELDKLANQLRLDCRYDHGHSGYTGTIAEDNGELTIIDDEMSEDDAHDFIVDTAMKWEESIAVKLKDTQNTWLIGGWYSC